MLTSFHFFRKKKKKESRAINFRPSHRFLVTSGSTNSPSVREPNSSSSLFAITKTTIECPSEISPNDSHLSHFTSHESEVICDADTRSTQTLNCFPCMSPCNISVASMHRWISCSVPDGWMKVQRECWWERDTDSYKISLLCQNRERRNHDLQNKTVKKPSHNKLGRRNLMKTFNLY